jgi:LmbE family N-acetylglucosaminyl deacetylase
MFSMLPQDQHPDHLAAALLSQNARFYAKLTKTDLPGEPYYPPLFLQYACSHLRRVFQPGAIVDISPTFPLKLEAVLAYRSQFGWREEAVREWLTTSAKFYGAKIGVRFGEPIFSPEELPVWDPVHLVRE